MMTFIRQISFLASLTLLSATTLGQQNLGLPPHTPVVSASNLAGATRLVEIPDTNGDGINDILVGLPAALNGRGAMIVVPGPMSAVASRTVNDAINWIRPPVPDNDGQVENLGQALFVGQDLNFDGRGEVWTLAKRVRQSGAIVDSIIVYDSVSLVVLAEFINVPNVATVWPSVAQQSSQHYVTTFTGTDSFPYTLMSDSPVACPTCSTSPPSSSSTSGGGSASTSGGSSTSNAVSSGTLQTSSTFTLPGPVQRAHNAAMEVANWATVPGVGVLELPRLVTIAVEARAFGQALGAGEADAANAARHAYWQAVMTYEIGYQVAREIGNIHEEGQEFGNLATRRDSWIDQYNNEKARRLAERILDQGGTFEELMEALRQALQDGEFIDDPKDPRVPAHLRDTDEDGIPDSQDCVPNVGTLTGNAHTLAVLKADIDNDGFVSDSDVSLVLQSAGETDMAKDQDGDCWIWIDDAATVSQLVGEFVQE